MYLVNGSVRRGNEPDFGHWRLDIEDRIQSKILKIWNVTVFPRRVNVSEFEPIDFVAVGIGPLNFNPDFVKKSETPHEALSGGLKFLARQMKVDIPPLPLSTPAEFSMLKEFCSQHPQPTTEDITNLCKHFLAKSNGMTIFPKLPSLIRPGIKRWEINETIRLLGLETEEGFRSLYQQYHYLILHQHSKQ